MGEVARVQYERRLFGLGLDLRDGGTQRCRDVGIRRLVEAYMAVADLYKPKAACALRLCSPFTLPERHSFQHTTRHRPRGTGADPRHALQKPATIQALLVI